MIARLLTPTVFAKYVWIEVNGFTQGRVGDIIIFDDGSMHMGTFGAFGSTGFPYGFATEPDHT